MEKDKKFMKASWWEGLTEGQLEPCSDGWGHAQKIVNTIFYWLVGLFSLLGLMGGNGDLLLKDLCQHAMAPKTIVFSAPYPTQATVDPCLHWRLQDMPRQVWLSLLWGHCSFLLSPTMHKVFFLPSKSLFPQSHGSSIIKSHWPSKSHSLGSQSLCQIPRLGNLLWALELSPECKKFFDIIVLQFVLMSNYHH